MGEFITDVTSDYQAAGFSELGPCTINATTTVGECADPNDTVYYIQEYVTSTVRFLFDAKFFQVILRRTHMS